jgi:secreted Zn-dependent insulinase-like peptidase
MSLFKNEMAIVFLYLLVKVSAFKLKSQLNENDFANETRIIKSENDKLEYKYLTLENEMKVVLIRDESTETSSIAMNISVGSMQNPKETQGLAHLLEHMLFLGKFLLLCN